MDWPYEHPCLTDPEDLTWDNYMDTYHDPEGPAASFDTTPSPPIDSNATLGVTTFPGGVSDYGNINQCSPPEELNQPGELQWDLLTPWYFILDACTPSSDQPKEVGLLPADTDSGSLSPEPQRAASVSSMSHKSRASFASCRTFWTADEEGVKFSSVVNKRLLQQLSFKARCVLLRLWGQDGRVFVEDDFRGGDNPLGEYVPLLESQVKDNAYAGPGSSSEEWCEAWLHDQAVMDFDKDFYNDCVCDHQVEEQRSPENSRRSAQSNLPQDEDIFTWHHDIIENTFPKSPLSNELDSEYDSDSDYSTAPSSRSSQSDFKTALSSRSLSMPYGWHDPSEGLASTVLYRKVQLVCPWCTMQYYHFTRNPSFLDAESKTEGLAEDTIRKKMYTYHHRDNGMLYDVKEREGVSPDEREADQVSYKMNRNIASHSTKPVRKYLFIDKAVIETCSCVPAQDLTKTDASSQTALQTKPEKRIEDNGINGINGQWYQTITDAVKTITDTALFVCKTAQELCNATDKQQTEQEAALETGIFCPTKEAERPANLETRPESCSTENKELKSCAVQLVRSVIQNAAKEYHRRNSEESTKSNSSVDGVFWSTAAPPSTQQTPSLDILYDGEMSSLKPIARKVVNKCLQKVFHQLNSKTATPIQSAKEQEIKKMIMKPIQDIARSSILYPEDLPNGTNKTNERDTCSCEREVDSSTMFKLKVESCKVDPCCEKQSNQTDESNLSEEKWWKDPSWMDLSSHGQGMRVGKHADCFECRRIKFLANESDKRLQVQSESLRTPSTRSGENANAETPNLDANFQIPRVSTRQMAKTRRLPRKKPGDYRRRSPARKFGLETKTTYKPPNDPFSFETTDNDRDRPNRNIFSIVPNVIPQPLIKVWSSPSPVWSSPSPVKPGPVTAQDKNAQPPDFIDNEERDRPIIFDFDNIAPVGHAGTFPLPPKDTFSFPEANKIQNDLKTQPQRKKSVHFSHECILQTKFSDHDTESNLAPVATKIHAYNAHLEKDTYSETSYGSKNWKTTCDRVDSQSNDLQKFPPSNLSRKERDQAHDVLTSKPTFFARPKPARRLRQTQETAATVKLPIKDSREPLEPMAMHNQTMEETPRFKSNCETIVTDASVSTTKQCDSTNSTDSVASSFTDKLDFFKSMNNGSIGTKTALTKSEPPVPKYRQTISVDTRGAAPTEVDLLPLEVKRSNLNLRSHQTLNAGFKPASKRLPHLPCEIVEMKQRWRVTQALPKNIRDSTSKDSSDPEEESQLKKIASGETTIRVYPSFDQNLKLWQEMDIAKNLHLPTPGNMTSQAGEQQQANINSKLVERRLSGSPDIESDQHHPVGKSLVANQQDHGIEDDSQSPAGAPHCSTTKTINLTKYVCGIKVQNAQGANANTINSDEKYQRFTHPRLAGPVGDRPPPAYPSSLHPKDTLVQSSNLGLERNDKPGGKFSIDRKEDEDQDNRPFHYEPRSVFRRHFKRVQLFKVFNDTEGEESDEC